MPVDTKIARVPSTLPDLPDALIPQSHPPRDPSLIGCGSREPSPAADSFIGHQFIVLTRRGVHRSVDSRVLCAARFVGLAARSPASGRHGRSHRHRNTTSLAADRRVARWNRDVDVIEWVGCTASNAWPDDEGLHPLRSLGRLAAEAAPKVPKIYCIAFPTRTIMCAMQQKWLLGSR
jgi:hypothetical protein